MGHLSIEQERLLYAELQLAKIQELLINRSNLTKDQIDQIVELTYLPWRPRRLPNAIPFQLREGTEKKGGQNAAPTHPRPPFTPPPQSHRPR